MDHSSDASFFFPFVGKSEAVEEMERENWSQKVSKRTFFADFFLDDCISFEHLGKSNLFFTPGISCLFK